MVERNTCKVKLAPNVLQTICYNFLSLHDACKMMIVSKSYH